MQQPNQQPAPIWVPGPDERGRFGQFGERYVPESLMVACDELEQM